MDGELGRGGGKVFSGLCLLCTIADAVRQRYDH